MENRRRKLILRIIGLGLIVVALLMFLYLTFISRSLEWKLPWIDCVTLFECTPSEFFDQEFDFYEVFDYIKVGEYKEEYGPLNKETTNQRLYEITSNNVIDITSKFWNKGKA
jgi:hypothetical protein